MKVQEAIEKVKDKYEGWMGYAKTQKEVDGLRKERDKIIRKPVKRTITIEIEGGDDIDLGLAKMIMKRALTDWDFKKAIKFKEVD